MNKFYFGKVIDNLDPNKLGRIKVRLFGITSFDGILDEHLPWYEPGIRFFENSFNIPEIGDICKVYCFDDIYHGEFFGFNPITENLFSDLSDDDYLKIKILIYDETLQIYKKESEGLFIIFNDSLIQIRADGSIKLQNTQSEKIIDINNGISIGQEGESNEPAVLGDKATETLNEINTSIKNLETVLTTGLQLIYETAQKSPYTLNLVPPILKLKNEIDTKSTKTFESLNEKIPTIKSDIVSLD